MSWLDTLLKPLGLQRAYDAAKNNHHRRVPTDTRSGNGLLDAARDKPRRWARHLDENVDLVTGLLTALSLRASAVTIEPAIRTTGGELASDLNARLSELWSAQGEHLEVTGLYSQAELRQVLARTWLRDGEVFAVHLEAARGVDYGGPVPYAIQALEPDYLPYDDRTEPQTTHGIQLSAIGRPVAYHFYTDHPGIGPHANANYRTAAIPAAQVSHLARRDRLHQLRGVTCLASVISRLDDLRDMEESERLAARFASAACAAITRQPGSESVSIDSDTLGDERSMFIEGGMIFDDLLPGEKVDLINPTRPNPNAIPWRKLQLQSAAAGTDASYSTTARDYAGTYSSQRQELVEHAFLVRERLTQPWVAKLWGPIYQRFAAAAFRHGVIAARQLRGIDVSTVTAAEYNPRGVPWIDMLKEVQAEAAAVNAGFKSRHQVIRERGLDPRQVDAELEADDFAPSATSPAQPSEVNDAAAL